MAGLSLKKRNGHQALFAGGYSAPGYRNARKKRAAAFAEMIDLCCNIGLHFQRAENPWPKWQGTLRIRLHVISTLTRTPDDWLPAGPDALG